MFVLLACATICAPDIIKRLGGRAVNSFVDAHGRRSRRVYMDILYVAPYFIYCI